MYVSLWALLAGCASSPSEKAPTDTAPDALDGDGDGFAPGEDCDDGDATVYPGATESCDGVDGDCDGVVDDDAHDAPTWFPDADGDGFGDERGAELACDAPDGWVSDWTDCDDTDPDVWPGAPEWCDGVDSDCDGETDDGALDRSEWFVDADGDGFGGSESTLACDRPDGYATYGGDCDDADVDANPAGAEVCDGVDQDCDGAVDEDEAVDAPTWYADADGDGYGDADVATRSCSQPDGTLSDASDCDDADAAVGPGGTEVCDGVDDDCDGAVDEDDAVDASTWYADADGDGFGDLAVVMRACDVPVGATSDATDCDDTDASVSPSAAERCDAVDDDCDGTVDEDDAVDASDWYGDADGDGYGDPLVVTHSCTAPAGTVSDGSDCDDADPTAMPGGTATWGDAGDHDCDGQMDVVDATSADVVLTGTASHYVGYALTAAGDVDGDGYDDLLVGAPAVRGAVYLVPGPLASGDVSAAAVATLTPPGTYTNFGAWLGAGAGDAQGDGYADLLVCHQPGSGDASMLRFDGPVSGSLGTTDADATWDGVDGVDGAAAWLGDVDGDGFDDVALTDNGDDTLASNAGVAWLVSGADGSGAVEDLGTAFYGESANDFAGTAVAGPGDLDGDGLADLVTSAASEDSGGLYSGAIYVVLGPATGISTLADADAKVSGDRAARYAGRFLAAAGDIDADGLPDVLVGTPDSGNGGAWVLSGPVASGALDAVASVHLDASLSGSEKLGHALAAGDFDGDGHRDVLVSCEYDYDMFGYTYPVYLFSGPLSGTLAAEASANPIDASYGWDLGWALGAMDADGDGATDMVLGAPRDPTVAASAGSVRVFLGR